MYMQVGASVHFDVVLSRVVYHLKVIVTLVLNFFVFGGLKVECSAHRPHQYLKWYGLSHVVVQMSTTKVAIIKQR